MKLSKVFLVVATLAVSIPAFAGTPVINQRQANQQNRINQGVASGQLNARETAKLQRGQQHVANMKANAKADGVVTRGERAQIRHAQNVQSNRIYNKKHN
jgi:uncharacterized membrane protein YebE (DUF533 family)